MAKLRPRHRPEEDFQMAPMIDMVFLLLVFFMTVSTIAQADKRVELDLPESVESKVPEDLSGRGTVSIDADGNLYLRSAVVSLEQVRASIREGLKANPELKIHVRADKATPYRNIRQVLKACAEEGAYEVVYATYEGKG